MYRETYARATARACRFISRHPTVTLAVLEHREDGTYWVLNAKQLPGRRAARVALGLPPFIVRAFIHRATVVCPSWPDPEHGDILGCGSTNVEGPDPEGLYDCLDCGIWFKATDRPTAK